MATRHSASNFYKPKAQNMGAVFPTSEKRRGRLKIHEPAILIGETETSLSGRSFPNTTRFSRYLVREILGEPPQCLKFDGDTYIGIRDFAEFIQRMGVEGLKAMAEGSVVVFPKKKAKLR